MTEQKDLQELKDEIKTLKEDIQSLTQTVKHLTSDDVDDTKGSIQDKVDLENLKELVQELSGKAKLNMSSVEKEIKENPLQTLAITFGLGLLVSQLFSSKK